MASVYINFVDEGVPDPFQPGSITVGQSCAALMPDGGEFAYAVMRPAPNTTLTLEQQVSLQDGADRAIYFRASPHSDWLLRGQDMVGTSSWTAKFGVPATVLALWDSSQVCPAGVPST